MKNQKPKMILFDYGETLIHERKFDGVKGTKAVLEYAISNKYGVTANDIQSEADALNRELGRFDPDRRHCFQIEVPNRMFTTYLYQLMGIELSLTSEEIDRVFWDAASPGVPTEYIEELLAFLQAENIRTGVISNICYSGDTVRERINSRLPNNDFEFIITSSETVFRKPNKRIFELALKKAELAPRDVWYIGDSYECDVVGARNAGLFPVWYLGSTQRLEKKDDVMTVFHWNELIEYLKEVCK